jgi:hypothetical protein
MFSSMSRRISPAGVVAVVALVFAMIGGAYAASGGLTGKQKKEVKKIAKSFQGKGPTGPAGPAGSAGAVGAKGDAGANGVTGPAGPAGPEGKQGEEGPEGSPWTAGGTLPKEKTETGVWSVTIGTSTTGTVATSFIIPLSAAPQVVYVPAGKEEEFEEDCPGNALAPAATEGVACFYTLALAETASESGEIPFPGGVFLTFNGVAGDEGIGTWAVMGG